MSGFGFPVFVGGNQPGGGYRGFQQTFKAFPIDTKRKGLESGGKILLPPSSLNTLSRLNIQYPMLFQISNHNKELNRQSHCGVLEFIAEEGICYLPYWMMQNLLLEPGDFIDIKNVSLPKGQFVRIQPHTSNFLDISNPKAVLENTLRKFATLTKDDEIMIDYNNNKYYLKVVELKPVNSANAISIIEADVEVDFAPPMDQKAEPVNQNTGTTTGGNSSGGLVFGSSTSKPIPLSGGRKSKDDSDSDDDSDDDTPKFKAFSGQGVKLSGKPDQPHKGSLGTSPKPPSLISSTPPKTLGTSPTTPPNEKKEFVPFQGKGYSLK